MAVNFFHIMMAFCLLIGVSFNSLFIVSIVFASLFIHQQLELNKIKSQNTTTEPNNTTQAPPQENTLQETVPLEPSEAHSEQTTEQESPSIAISFQKNELPEHKNISQERPTPESEPTNKEQWVPVVDKIQNTFSQDWTNKPKDLFNKAFDFINGVDLITKVGALIFLIGIGFLIKYTSTLFEITPQIKISGTLLTGAIIFGLGFKLLKKYSRYGASLEGLGLGIMYLGVYFGLTFYNLFSVNVAVISMIGISSLMIATSLKQDQQILSGLAYLGVFLAPVLEPNESGNIFLLTNYFLLINASILCIVFYKNWSLIVIEGFLLTFSTLSYWFLMNTFEGYTNCLYPLTAILIIYIYLPLRILEKAPLQEKYLSLIVCGTPAVISTLHYNLLPEIGYIKSASAIFFAAFYLLLFKEFVNKIKNTNPNTSRAYEIIGVILLSFSLLFVTNYMVASIAWAFEATLGLWLAQKQGEKWRVYFCLSILGFSILSWLSSMPHPYGDYVFLNLSYFGTAVLTGALIYSAYLLRKFRPKELSHVMLSLGNLWFLFETHNQLATYFEYASISYEIILSFVIATMMLLSCELQKKLKWHSLILVYEYMSILTLVIITMASGLLIFTDNLHFAFIIPALAVLTAYSLVKERTGKPLLLQKGILAYFTGLGAWLYIAMIIDGLYFDTIFVGDYIASLCLSTILLYFMINNNKTSIFMKQLRGDLTVTKGLLLSGLMGLTVLLSIFDPNIKYSYIPFLSFVDAIQIISVCCIGHWWYNNKNSEHKHLNEIQIAFAAFTGVTATILLLRIMHYFLSIPYELDALLNNGLVQVSLTLLWACMGILIVYYSTVKENDIVKKVGMTILALVTVKLFIIDISDGFSRIIAFIVIGALYLLFGYWLQKKEKRLKTFNTTKK